MLEICIHWFCSQVRIHPGSINSGAREAEDDSCTAAVFDELTRNEAFLYVISSTLVRPHFLPLVAAHLALAPDDPVRPAASV